MLSHQIFVEHLLVLVRHSHFDCVSNGDWRGKLQCSAFDCSRKSLEAHRPLSTIFSDTTVCITLYMLSFDTYTWKISHRRNRVWERNFDIVSTRKLNSGKENASLNWKWNYDDIDSEFISFDLHLKCKLIVSARSLFSLLD